MTRGSALVALVTVPLVACAAGRKGPEAPAASGAPSDQVSAGYAQQPAGEAAPPPPAAIAPPGAGAAPQAGATSPYAPPPSRAIALGQASNEIETSQRELDVAGGDCRNACRALGSMDRAAGRLCGLAQSNDEQRRCSDAKVRVYSARDKVKNTCGSCPDVTVDRDAPIPSR